MVIQEGLAKGYFGIGGGRLCGVARVALIKTVNKSISRLRNTNYPMTVSPENKLVIKIKEMWWVCKGKFVEGSGETLVRTHNHLSNLFLSGGVTFVDWYANRFTYVHSLNT